MDLNELQLTTVLQEAFTCYLAFLSHQQKLREEKLPRQGKGVETSADILTRDHYRSRVAGIETCIQCSDRIARRVLRWSSDPDDIIRDQTVHIEPQAERFESFLDEEVPFLDPFTGAWIHPITASSAGPSDRDGGATSKRVESPRTVQTSSLPKSRPVEKRETKAPEVKQIRPIFRTSTRPSLGLHPNIPLSISNISIDKAPVSRSKSLPSATLVIPESSTTSDDESDSDSEEESEEENEEDNKSAGEHKEEESSEEESSEDSEDDSEESDGDNTSITSEMASAFYLQRGGRDTTQSQKLHAEEKIRKDNILRSQQQARQKADNWAREEKARLDEQEAYAKRLEREERARQEQIRTDREAAQRAQARWELAALALAAETKRKDEKRRKEADERRVVDEQRRSRQERERSARTVEHSRTRDYGSKEDRRTRDVSRTRHRHHERRLSPARRPSPPRRGEPFAPPKRTRFSDREPSKRRSSSSAPGRSEPPKKPETPKRSEINRRDEPARKFSPPRRVEPAKKADPPKKVDCVSCMEPGSKKDMAVLVCEHAYCADCINEAFKSAYNSHSLFKCCNKPVPASSIPMLSSSMTKKYSLLTLELSTPNPKFCSKASCSTFLPPSSIHGPLGICASCKTRTCIPCGKAEHSGVCKQDKEGKKLEDLAKKKGWKQCPNCSQILERTYGCLHMTCRCGSNWCYSCLRDWDVCGSACSRDDPNHGYAHPGPPPMPGGADNPWVRLADLAAPARNRTAAAANFHAALADRMGDNVQVQHDRNTGNTRMRGEGAGSVFPVIATAVLMALMRERE